MVDSRLIQLPNLPQPTEERETTTTNRIRLPEHTGKQSNTNLIETSNAKQRQKLSKRNRGKIQSREREIQKKNADTTTFSDKERKDLYSIVSSFLFGKH